jgi:hypothetical protein
MKGGGRSVPSGPRAGAPAGEGGVRLAKTRNSPVFQLRSPI